MACVHVVHVHQIRNRNRLGCVSTGRRVHCTCTQRKVPPLHINPTTTCMTVTHTHTHSHRPNRYHYVPWLVLMHCALALLVTLLVIVLNSLVCTKRRRPAADKQASKPSHTGRCALQNQTYVASQRRNWIHFLYPSDYSQFIGTSRTCQGSPSLAAHVGNHPLSPHVCAMQATR